MLSLTLILVSFIAAAQPPRPQREAAEDKARTVPGGGSLGVKACHDDIERWCKDVKPGDGRLGACLHAREKKLSKKCRRWADHGGASHAAEAYRDIDKAMAPKLQ